MAIPERYNTGYNIGVGGAVVRDGRLLLVRRASRRGRGNWQLPGGFIEPDETIEQAVIREVQEEAGVVAEVEGAPVESKVGGVLRGILRDGIQVLEGMKVGDVDPRGTREHCFIISDKARAIGGGVLEAILMRYNK